MEPGTKLELKPAAPLFVALHISSKFFSRPVLLSVEQSANLWRWLQCEYLVR